LGSRKLEQKKGGKAPEDRGLSKEKEGLLTEERRTEKKQRGKGLK